MPTPIAEHLGIAVSRSGMVSEPCPKQVQTDCPPPQPSRCWTADIQLATPQHAQMAPLALLAFVWPPSLMQTLGSDFYLLLEKDFPEGVLWWNEREAQESECALPLHVSALFGFPQGLPGS